LIKTGTVSFPEKNAFKHLKTSYQKLQDDTNSCLSRSLQSRFIYLYSRRYGNPFWWSIIVSQWSSIYTSKWNASSIFVG